MIGFEARDRVVARYHAEGLAVMVLNDGWTARHSTERAVRRARPRWSLLVETKPIMQPFGDRSKVVIEPMLTDQWFVDTDKIVGPAIDAVRRRREDHARTA